MGVSRQVFFAKKLDDSTVEHGSKLAGIPAHMIEMQYGNINNNDIWYISVSENGDIPYGITIQNGNW